MLAVKNLKETASRRRQGERGAALITTLLISLLMLSAGGALILTTAMSFTNAADATAESQAYYAAESGLQSVLNVLRGNVAPATTSTTAAENLISFRNAITTSISNKSTDTAYARLSRWLPYNATYDCVPISDSYTPLNGMAFKVTELSDPDNSVTVTYTTSGIFPSTNTDTKDFNQTGGNKATLKYNPTGTTTVTQSGTVDFGKIQITSITGSVTLVDEPFKLTITQSAPWAGTVSLDCKLNGIITSTSSLISVTFPALPNNTNNIEGTLYARTLNPLTTNNSTTMPVKVTAPEPRRMVVRVIGYGPHGAQKKMQMLLNRAAFDFTPSSVLTIRGSDSASSTNTMSFQIGDSAKYQYSGNDNSGGVNLPGFAVTNSYDYTTATGALPSGAQTQVTGNPVVSQISTTSLATMLQTADGARAALDTLRELAKGQRYPMGTGCNTQSDDDRYFASGETPCDFGATQPNGLLTFVDGDVDLPPAGGAGILVVTGKLYMRGSAAFKGIILVLGTGELIRDGGGNGTTLGTIVVAKFGATGGFTVPVFNGNGIGTANVFYDSDWIRKVLAGLGPRVVAVSEY